MSLLPIKNIISYAFKVDGHISASELSDKLEDALSKARFHPCGPNDVHSSGWVPTSYGDNNEPLLTKQLPDLVVIKYASEKKSVPAAVIRVELAKIVEKYEHEQGQKPSKGELRAMKENVVATLLPRAFPQRTDIVAWIDLKNDTINVNTSSANKAEDILKSLRVVYDGFESVTRLDAVSSPSTLMTEWLLLDAGDDSSTGNFNVDDKCELVMPIENKPTIKYVRHNLEGTEIKSYLAEGRVPVSLSLTYNDRVSFTLTDKFHLKGLKMSEVLKNQTAEDELDADGELLLVLSTVRGLVDELVDAMGGRR